MKIHLGLTALVALSVGCSDHMIAGPEPAAEEWIVTGDADIIVYADTSTSMQDNTLETVASSVEVILARLGEADVNWQVLAVTGPDGCGQNGIITDETEDWQNKFAEGIRLPPEPQFDENGVDLSVDEWGLFNAQAAVDASAPGGCNEGFLRDDAHLHVVYISDEDDNSPGFDGTDPEYWRPYVDAVVASKADPAFVHLSAVTGPAPVGCSFADYGRGYVEAVNSVEGELLSICDDWAFEADALADTSVTRDSFTLKDPPIEGSIRMFVDGLERIGGWTHDPELNEVVFASDLPFAGQEVRATYDVGYDRN